jgi:hypothetical protein
VPHRPPPAPASQAALPDLTKALVGTADLPSGWSVDKDTTPLVALGASDNATCAKETAALTSLPKAPAHAEVRFTSGTTALLQQWGSWPTVAAADAVFDQVKTALATCHKFTVPGSLGQPTAFSVTAQPDPVVGEESLALKGSTAAMGVTVQLGAVLARSGSTLELVAAGGIGLDQNLVTKTARTGIDRLRSGN